MNRRKITVEEAGVAEFYEVYEFGTPGAKPEIFFTGGVHGNEFTGIYTAGRLIDFFKQNPPIKGSVKVIPCVNTAAMRIMKRRSPFDGEDLNRIFPGTNGDSVSYKLAAAIYEETASADVIVDLHCCGSNGLPYILSIYHESEKAKALASMITMPIALRSQGTEGQLFTESCRKRSQAALIIELPSGVGEGAVNVPVSDICYAGLMDMLCAYGVVAGEVKGKAPEFFGEILDLEAGLSGLWTSAVSRGDRVEKGQRIGDVDGEAVFAPESGLILSVLPCGYLMPGDTEVGAYIVPADVN